MNWLIQEKRFTYFYNKFRPVNRMHYMKCGVNSSLHNSGRCRGLWHLGSLFYHDTNSQRGWYITNLHLCGIPQNKAPRPGPRHIWCTCTVRPFFGCENTDGRTVVLIISLASVCYGDFCWGLLLLLLNIIFNIASLQVGVSNQNFTDGFLLKFYFFSPGHCSIPTMIVCLVV